MSTSLSAISIITVVYNNRDCIESAIKSVLCQTYKDIEYIIVDGGSTDGTLDIIRSYGTKISKLVSERDGGIYDAMNKGIKMASGDIVGILNSDDSYANDSVIESVVSVLKDKNIDACYGDLVYVDRRRTDRIVRYWKARAYQEYLFSTGWMPPHPTFFAKRWVYEKYGDFDLALSAVADHELLLRLMYSHKIRTCYIPKVLVRMRLGGITNNNVLNILKQNCAIIKTLREYKINVFPPCFFLNKFIERIKQFFSKC